MDFGGSLHPIFAEVVSHSKAFLKKMKMLFLRKTYIAAIVCIGASALLISQKSADTAVYTDSCLKLPYLKKAGIQGPISVWIVDGAVFGIYR